MRVGGELVYNLPAAWSARQAACRSSESNGATWYERGGATIRAWQTLDFDLWRQRRVVSPGSTFCISAAS